MTSKNIIFTIKSNNGGYKYKGVSDINRDIIKFVDKDSYIIDRKVKRINKNSNDLILDFINNKVYIENYKYSIDINVNKYIDDDNLLDIEYCLEGDTFNIKLVVGDQNE
jgi:hypothetical protein